MNDITLNCQAILFDCDGVLVDSDASVARAWTRWALKYNLDHHEVNVMVHGRRASDTVALLIEPDLQAEALADITLYEIEDAPTVQAIPGALEMTRHVPRAAWAVVTSGTTALATARLRAAGIEAPDVLVTADCVANGKPAPDGYLSAAESLHTSPHDTVVVEDSPSGVRAARAAGVAAVVGVGTRALDTDADVVVSDLQGLSWRDQALQIAGSSVLRHK